MASTARQKAPQAPAAAPLAQPQLMRAQDGKIYIQEYEYNPNRVYDDPWNTYVRGVVIARGAAKEAPYVYVGVNGQNYQIPRGKPQDIPVPLYDRIRIMRQAEEAEAEYRARLRREVNTEMRRV